MNVLRQAKNNRPISPNLASALISSLQIQILSILILNKNIPILMKVLKLTDISSEFLTQEISLVNFGLNLLQITVLMVKIVNLMRENKKQQVSYYQSDLLRFLQIKPYLLFVQIININSNSLYNPSLGINAIAVFNIAFGIIQLVILKVINISYRFIEKNYIRRKNNSIVPWILVVAIIFCLNSYGSLYASFFIFLRALVQLYNNLNALQNQSIRRLEWFYPLLSILLVTMVWMQSYFTVSIFDSFLLYSFALGLAIYCCAELSGNLSLQVIKIKLKNSRSFLQAQTQKANTQSGRTVQIGQKELQAAVIDLRILVKIYLSRLQYKNFDQNSQFPCDNFNNWWKLFNRFIIDHKISCKNVNCMCLQLQPGFGNKNKFQNQLFLEKIYSIIKNLLTNSSTNDNKLKIIQNYFLIEIQKRPLKTYYQIVKLFESTENRQQILEIQSLMLETRDKFKQYFLKQKVQNQDLEIEPLLVFQSKLRKMKIKIGVLSLEQKKFYDFFASNFVQMDALKKQTRILTKQKKYFNAQFDDLLKRFEKNLELVVFSLVYYRFFDEYTDKIQKLELKAQGLYIAQRSTQTVNKKKAVDIFDPSSGAIRIDLAFNIGKIIGISRNICNALGYSYQQVIGQKINKLMPFMFSRYHDRFLRSFIQKGSVRMLKLKQIILFSKNASKYIFAISVLIKVQFSSPQSFSACSLVKKAPTKSEFILINNYGKIEQITQKIYKVLFEKGFGEDIAKIKKLCILKMLLPLNSLLKSTTQNDDRVYEGIIVSSATQELLMSYYKFPSLGNSMRKGQISQSKIRSSQNIDVVACSSSQTCRTLDFSEDMDKYNIDLKQSFKEYFKKIKFDQINGYKISYKFYDYITSQFKCKILEIVSIKYQIQSHELRQHLSKQIVQVAKYLGFHQEQVKEFKYVIQKSQKEGFQFNPRSQQQQNQFKKSIKLNQLSERDSRKYLIQQKDNLIIQNCGSEASSLIARNQQVKKKSSIISAFQEKTVVVSSSLQLFLTGLILLMALTLVIICVFSINLKGNYQVLQRDKMMINNFRINFLLRVAIQELYHFYQLFDIRPPQFFESKKNYLSNQMKEILKKSIQYIDPISSHQYFKQITFTQVETGFVQHRSVLSALEIIYFMFLKNQNQGQHITDNFISISYRLTQVITNQEKYIREKSQSYILQTHIVIILYSFILMVLVIVLIWFRKIAIQKESKITEYLPFFKSSAAKGKSQFYEFFYQFNKESQNIQLQKITELQKNFEDSKTFSKGYNINTLQLNKNEVAPESNLSKSRPQEYSNLKLIRVVRNEKTTINKKMLSFGLVVVLLCAFVIFYAQYFVSQIHSKFQAYLQLRNAVVMVQLIPSRAIILYLINTDRILNKQPMMVFPYYNEDVTHNTFFKLQKNLYSTQIFGSQMEKVISNHFDTKICQMVTCSSDWDASSVVQDQQINFLAYRYLNAFQYMRKIIDKLPDDKDPKTTIRKWIEQNNVVQILQANQYIIELMNKNQKEISDLFDHQINQIGFILLSLSLTLIPILIVVMFFVRRMFINHFSRRLENTQNIFKQFSWNMLMQNTYAVNYFADKLRNSKKY